MPLLLDVAATDAGNQAKVELRSWLVDVGGNRMQWLHAGRNMEKMQRVIK